MSKKHPLKIERMVDGGGWAIAYLTKGHHHTREEFFGAVEAEDAEYNERQFAPGETNLERRRECARPSAWPEKGAPTRGAPGAGMVQGPLHLHHPAIAATGNRCANCTLPLVRDEVGASEPQPEHQQRGVSDCHVRRHAREVVNTPHFRLIYRK